VEGPVFRRAPAVHAARLADGDASTPLSSSGSRIEAKIEMEDGTAIGLGRQVVKTIDGEEVEVGKARNMSRRMYLTGFALLPWMWVMNVWLFWNEFFDGGDPVIQSYTRKSAVGVLVASMVFVPWMLAYVIGQERLFGATLFQKLDASRLDLD